MVGDLVVFHYVRERNRDSPCMAQTKLGLQSERKRVYRAEASATEGEASESCGEKHL